MQLKSGRGSGELRNSQVELLCGMRVKKSPGEASSRKFDEAVQPSRPAKRVLPCSGCDRPSRKQER